MRNLQLRQCALSHPLLACVDAVIRINRGAAEEARKYHVQASGFARAREHQIVGNDTQICPQLKHIPRVLTKDRHRGVSSSNRITLACDGPNERRLPAAVGSENGNVLVGPDAETEIVERNRVSPHNAQVAIIQQGWFKVSVHGIQSVDEHRK